MSNSNVFGRLVIQANSSTPEKVIPYALLGMTVVTGLVDAVSFLSLGHVFIANMTGNIVFLAFATAHSSGLSIARTFTALLAVRLGAIIGGRVMARANPDSQIRFAVQAFVLEGAFLFAASFCGIGYRSDLQTHPFQPIALIALTAVAMGIRNAAVRKLAIPDLTTSVLTMTITGIGADSALANGNSPRLVRRVASVAAMFLGAALGASVIHYSISAVLWLATAISAVCSAALFPSVLKSDKQ